MVQRVERVIEALDEFVEQVIIRLSTEITANLIETTPVDTGWARANWVPAIGQPVRDPAGSPEAVNTAEQNSGISGLLRYQRERGSVFISNNVPYIIYLNAGSSAQAPSGFVENAIDRGIATVRARGGR